MHVAYCKFQNASVHVYVLYMYMTMSTYMYFEYTHIYICIYMYTSIYTYTYRYMYLYIHAHRMLQGLKRACHRPTRCRLKSDPQAACSTPGLGGCCRMSKRSRMDRHPASEHQTNLEEPAPFPCRHELEGWFRDWGLGSRVSGIKLQGLSLPLPAPLNYR